MAIEKLSSSARQLRLILEGGLHKRAFVPQDASGGAPPPGGPPGGDPSQGGGAPPGGPPPGGDPSGGAGGPPPGGPPPGGAGGDPGGGPDQMVSLSMPDLMQMMQMMMQQQGGGGMPQDPNAPPGQPGQPGQPGAAPGGKGKGMDLVVQKIDDLTKKIGEMVAFQQGVKSVTDPAEAGDTGGAGGGAPPDASGIGMSMGGGVDPSQGPQGGPPTLPGGVMPGGAPPGGPDGGAPKTAALRKQAAAPVRLASSGNAKYLNTIMNNLMSRT